MRYDVNQLRSPPLFEVIPWISDTSKAAIHIKGGDFQEVVFIVDKVKLDVSELNEEHFAVDFSVVEWDKKIYPDITDPLQIQENDVFQSEVAKILNVILMSSVARAYEIAAETTKDIREVLARKGVELTEKKEVKKDGPKPRAKRKTRAANARGNNPPSEVSD